MDTSDGHWMSGTYLELTQTGIQGILMFGIGYLWIVLSPNGFVATGDMPLANAAIMGAMGITWMPPRPCAWNCLRCRPFGPRAA